MFAVGFGRSFVITVPMLDAASCGYSRGEMDLVENPFRGWLEM